MWNKLNIIVILLGAGLVWSQFYDCHDDPGFDPDEGVVKDLQFTWLGALQYIHVKNGTPHYFRVPRVILISRQFVLSTAEDAAQIPEGFALGNVIFGDYERDERECRASVQDLLSLKSECAPAILLMPLSDVLLHPEYKHFGAKTSIALLKLFTPVGSRYVVPVCLPFKNFLIGENGKQIRERIYHIDFMSDVPRDFMEEDKEVSRHSLLPRELCFLYDQPENGSRITKDRIACTTGCGFRSGAPSVIHEHTGHWSVVALAQGTNQLDITRHPHQTEWISIGGFPCPDPLRARRPPPPPRHILLHPYVPWITAAISGKAVGGFAKDDPFGYVMPRAGAAGSYDSIGHGWVGHWWMGGMRCYDRGEAANDLFRFYHEIFTVKPMSTTYLSYYLEINTMPMSLIMCVKIGMPFQLGHPKVWDLDTPEVRVKIPLITFEHTYRFQVEAWAVNSSDADSSPSQEESLDSESYRNG